MRPEEPHNLPIDLASVCTAMLQYLFARRGAEILGIDVKAVTTKRFDSAKEQPCYIVRLQTENASLLRGDGNRFKGSYKERIEGILDFLIKRADPNAGVHLEIVGPNPTTVDTLVEIDHLLRSAQLPDDAPLAVAARTYGMPYVLFR